MVEVPPLQGLQVFWDGDPGLRSLLASARAFKLMAFSPHGLARRGRT